MTGSKRAGNEGAGNDPSRAEPGLNTPSALDRINTAGKDETDTSAKGASDRSGAAKTSGDKSESATDRDITQRVRQAVMANDELSSQAKSAKISTSDGVVTLRGPVSSSQEKTQLSTLANGIDGVKRVDNQLEISSK